MPGKWSDTHRAAYEETMRLRREARASGGEWKPPGRRTRRTTVEVVTVEPKPVGIVGIVGSAVGAAADYERMFDRVQQMLGAEVDDLASKAQDIQRLAATQAEELSAIRTSVLRVENKAILALDRVGERKPAQDALGRDPDLVTAMRTIAKRVGQLEASIEAVVARNDEVLALLRRIDSRPARVIEYRPDHRRVKDGGEPVREQRKRAGLSKRGPRTAA